MIAVTEDDAATEIRIVAEPFVRLTALGDRLEVERVALLRPVHADEEDVALAFEGDSLTHRGCSPS